MKSIGAYMVVRVKDFYLSFIKLVRDKLETLADLKNSRSMEANYES